MKLTERGVTVLLLALTLAVLMVGSALGVVEVKSGPMEGVTWEQFSVAVQGTECQEDEVIVGRGDYDPVVGWSRYVCVPRDDL